MRLQHLTLHHFRNYSRLDCDLPPGMTILWGNNAQGKSNLLEAIFYLATFRSFRASSDRDLLNWGLAEDPIGFCRIGARIDRGGEPREIEIILREESRRDAGESTRLSKRIKLDDAPRRAIEVIGTAIAVLFSPQDLDLVEGAPALRRRYLDVTISQADRGYCRNLAHYNRVISQRNHLLRAIRDRGTSPDQLHFWNHELVTSGAQIVARRLEAVGRIGALAQRSYQDLSATSESLLVAYRSSIDRTSIDVDPSADPSADAAEIAGRFEARLAELQAREILLGVSLTGPHRDDLTFALDGHDLGAFGSRGQQRTAALALKLAEAGHLASQTGESPILLLDDVLSELDPRRRERVIQAIRPGQQVLLSTADPQTIAGLPAADATWLRVMHGRLEPGKPMG